MMGKRSSFDRVPRDFYPTPIEAVYPLLPHLKASQMFIEPCAGDGRVKWIPDSAMTGKDNAAWYLFDQSRTDTGTLFCGRSA